jgi:hypothetical protein
MAAVFARNSAATVEELSDGMLLLLVFSLMLILLLSPVLDKESPEPVLLAVAKLAVVDKSSPDCDATESDPDSRLPLGLRLRPVLEPLYPPGDM